MALLEYDQYGNSVTPPEKLPTLGRLAGLGLILIGGFYICLILAAAIRIIWNPAVLTPALGAMTRALDLQDAAVTITQSKIPIGHMVACIGLILWYVITSSIALRLIVVGGQLTRQDKTAQRQMIGFMRDFAAAVRQQRV
jgi:hypothetical protein